MRKYRDPLAEAEMQRQVRLTERLMRSVAAAAPDPNSEHSPFDGTRAAAARGISSGPDRAKRAPNRPAYSIT